MKNELDKQLEPKQIYQSADKTGQRRNKLQEPNHQEEHDLQEPISLDINNNANPMDDLNDDDDFRQQEKRVSNLDEEHSIENIRQSMGMFAP